MKKSNLFVSSLLASTVLFTGVSGTMEAAEDHQATNEDQAHTQTQASQGQRPYGGVVPKGMTEAQYQELENNVPHYGHETAESFSHAVDRETQRIADEYKVTIYAPNKTYKPQIRPWYAYKGHTSYDSSFIVESTFVNAVKHNNVTLNGYKINMVTPKESEPMAIKNVADTQITNFDDAGMPHIANFDVKKGQISKQDIIKAYGQPAQVKEGENNQFSMTYNIDDAIISFNFDANGYVQKGHLGI
ncbi:immunodominant staphylococcal antigen IsaB family protein [Staphylococcus massiliensis]|uniref:Immunodominant staphylococcal antigen B n=1 Tax=Staphylococcus massiliensis S46 TaxID=1229783 RepID=K9AMC4_9STAP|nr:hypothetical protein [Staphylococcus massiliensis]EKU48533.1 putative LPXAG surface protein [Staphylococcus massiliensis S46]MCG3400086.1 LPXAG surface protein [Staphylococcus massiliensis]MCG3401808.1 LPXAG surface protein [Staphylococcus massiliensis]MCG3412681.1 LPXAG surface protein [Staphylococcus massiliensis]POA01542.1 LPXAG surface protein [Staphylococcus massiliensis CCUG 55927]